MREALKNMQLRLTELSEYLDISRPTLYKFVDYYDTGQKSLINKSVLKLFDYISSNKDIDKKDVISYIANGNLLDDEESRLDKLVLFIQEVISRRELTDYEWVEIEKIIKGVKK